MTRKSPPPPTNPADDDWTRETADVRPLGGPRSRKPKPRAVQPPIQVYHQPQSAHRPFTILNRDSHTLAGLEDNLDAKLLKDLAKGLYPPEATLDLHGLHEGDAWMELMGWLSAAADHDCRCVLVITGKGRGYGPDGDMGLIKSQIPQWLASHPKVMAFHTALPRDGGAGAVYVFLR